MPITSKKSWKKPRNSKKILKKTKFLGFFKIALEKTQKTHLKKPGFQVGFFKLPTLGPVMVSSTLCPAVHISGSQNVYSRAEGIADHY